MKTEILVALIVLSIFTVSCARQATVTENQQVQENTPTLEPEAETTKYIDSQIVDPAQDIEIGDMI